MEISRLPLGQSQLNLETKENGSENSVFILNYLSTAFQYVVLDDLGWQWIGDKVSLTAVL